MSKATHRAILIFNARSSSIKFALYHPEECYLLAAGAIDSIVSCQPVLRIKQNQHEWFKSISEIPQSGSHQVLSAWLMNCLSGLDAVMLLAAGHRVVHGGMHFSQPAIVTSELIWQLTEYTSLAPNHQPYSLAAIEVVHQQWSELPEHAQRVR